MSTVLNFLSFIAASIQALPPHIHSIMNRKTVSLSPFNWPTEEHYIILQLVFFPRLANVWFIEKSHTQWHVVILQQGRMVVEKKKSQPIR